MMPLEAVGRRHAPVVAVLLAMSKKDGRFANGVDLAQFDMSSE
jgi:hypothetical protein